MSTFAARRALDAPLAGSVSFHAFAVFLATAPLFKAGNRPGPLLALEGAALGFLVLVALSPRVSLGGSRSLGAGIAMLLAYPLLQLLPLPGEWWGALPGRATYASTLASFGPASAASAWHGVSIVPVATEYGWLALLPPVACFAMTLQLRPERIVDLLLVLCLVAGMEALLGLVQVGAGGDSMFYLRTERSFGTAVGTFANRNHYAALLAMALPMLVGLVAYGLKHRRRHGHRSPGGGADVASRRAILAALGVLILLALIFTRSRAGMATALVGLSCSALLLVRLRAGRAAHLFVAGAIALALLIAIAVGLTPVLERFEPAQLRVSGDERLGIYATTMRAAVEFLPLGSGLSTFAHVLPQFQTSWLGGHVEYAHNEYLQVLMELGLPGLAAIGLLLFAYAKRMTDLALRSSGRSFVVVQLGAGIALLPLMLHSLFDFSLHIPAVAMWYATLAGVAFHGGATRAHEPVEPTT